MDRRHGQHNQHDVAQQTKWGPNYLLIRFKEGRNSFLVIYILVIKTRRASGEKAEGIFYRV